MQSEATDKQSRYLGKYSQGYFRKTFMIKTTFLEYLTFGASVYPYGKFTHANTGVDENAPPRSYVSITTAPQLFWCVYSRPESRPPPV